MKKLTEIDPRIKVDLKDLLNEPVLVTVNEFAEDTVRKFRHSFDQAHDTGQPVIPVLIDTYGGEVYSLMAMIDILDAATVPVSTIAIGKTMSCGAVLLSCGRPGMRYVAPNAHVMIHDLSLGVYGKTKEVDSRAAQGRFLNEIAYRRMATNCGHPPGYFLDMVHEHHGHADWYLDAKAARKHGLANKIGLPTMRTVVKVEMKFGIGP